MLGTRPNVSFECETLLSVGVTVVAALRLATVRALMCTLIVWRINVLGAR